MNVKEALESWQIPVVGAPELNNEVREFLLEWCKEVNAKGVLITESQELETASAADTASWVIEQCLVNQTIHKFAHRLNGISFFSQRSQEEHAESFSKMDSCDLLWVEEIAGGSLTDHERTLLHDFLLRTLNDRMIFSVSTSVEQLSDWIGEVNIKRLIRNLTVIQV